jgi:hypothetical protein
MRILFKKSTRPKKAARALSEVTGRPLAACQQAIAKACGYRDWHELEALVPSANEEMSSQAIQSEKIIAREVAVVTAVARSLTANAGDVQYALATSRLTGNRPTNPREALEIRRQLFEAIDLPPKRHLESGATVKVKRGSCDGKHMILSSQNWPMSAIAHHTVNICIARSDFVIPKQPLPLFIPRRLYVPYGEWTEADGAKVLFSRDYKPLWRIRNNHAPERLQPWLWITHVREYHFWGTRDYQCKAIYPLQDLRTYEQEMDRLAAFGILGMPLLVETLPILIHRASVSDIESAVEALHKTYVNKPSDMPH